MSLNPFTWFTKSTVEAGAEAADKIADIVERWKPGETAKHEMVQDIQRLYMDSQASARAADAPLNSGVPFIDGVVNLINRSIRPGVTVGIFGGLMGWWALPAPETMDPIWFSYGETVLLFWFGGRALFKDLPAALAYFKK